MLLERVEDRALQPSLRLPEQGVDELLLDGRVDARAASMMLLGNPLLLGAPVARSNARNSAFTVRWSCSINLMGSMGAHEAIAVPPDADRLETGELVNGLSSAIGGSPFIARCERECPPVLATQNCRHRQRGGLCRGGKALPWRAPTLVSRAAGGTAAAVALSERLRRIDVAALAGRARTAAPRFEAAPSARARPAEQARQHRIWNREPKVRVVW